MAERQAPWAHRRASRPTAVAGPDGKPVSLRCIRHNGIEQWVPVVYEPNTPTKEAPPERSQLDELRRRVSAEIARYRRDKQLSEKEFRTVVALWEQGVTLREHARREAVAPQAIEARIQAMKYRALRFWTWWRLKHRMRHRD